MDKGLSGNCNPFRYDELTLSALFSQSLGVVLYVLVCGSLPFDAPSLPALRQRVTEGRFRIPFFMSQGPYLPFMKSKTELHRISRAHRISFIFLLTADCENLIRKMLVVDPSKRISVAQIKQHRWMLADPSAARQTLSHSLTEYNSNLGDYSEPVLGIMNTLGIDRQRTIEVTDRNRKLLTHLQCLVNIFKLLQSELKVSTRFFF